MLDKTLNNITDRLKLLSEEHLMLQDFNVGDTADIGTESENGRKLKYPYLHIDYANTNYSFGTGRGIGFKLYTMTLVVLDKISDSITTSTESMSDTEGIISDIIQFITTDSSMRDFKIPVSSIVASPVADNTNDGTEGWTCQVGFKIPYGFCSSQLPFIKENVPPIIIPQSIVSNSDDSYVVTLESGENLTLPDTNFNFNYGGTITTITVPSMINHTITIN